MSEILIILSFVSGLVAGVGITVYGYRLGWKASYQIRDGKEAAVTLFPEDKEPAEFELLDKKERK